MSDGTSSGRQRRRQVWRKLVSEGLKFAACMRVHGFPDFPDLGRGPGVSQGQLTKLGIDSNSPQFQSARRTCLKPLSGMLP